MKTPNKFQPPITNQQVPSLKFEEIFNSKYHTDPIMKTHPSLSILSPTSHRSTRSMRTRRSGVFSPALRSLFCAVVLLTALPNVDAAPPESMTYQGFLVDANGNPLATNNPANYPVIFRIFTAPAGGATLWSEQQIVTVDKGNFSVLLGEGTPVSGEPRPPLSSIFAGPTSADRYVSLSVTVGSITSEMLPRLRLLPSPYAFLATSANNLVNASGSPVLSYANNRVEVTGDVFASGNVNFGSAINAATLNVSGLANVGYLAVNAGGGNEGGEILLRGTGGPSNPDWAIDNFLGQTRFISEGGVKFSVNNAGNAFVAGNLGVGITAPTARLHVNGLTKFEGTSGVEFGAGVAGKEANAGRVGYQLFSADALDIVGAGTGLGNRKIRVWADGGTEFTGGVTANGVTANGNVTLNDQMFLLRGGGDLNHGMAWSPVVDGPEFRGYSGFRWTTGDQGANERMRIASDGNVGIGTPAPTAKLEVNGDVKIKGERPFAFKTFTGAGGVMLNTGWPTNRYVVSIAGFQANGGDILESTETGNLIVVKAVPGFFGTPNWFIQADFRTHNGNETWTVNAMRVVRELVTDDSTF
ncbi:MAG TPA: hypothetical protein VJS65_15140 [Verrucomicrobiae bacterium]|nr:hypothetical protein [Verrucomicrobiae bacterium]